MLDIQRQTETDIETDKQTDRETCRQYDKLNNVLSTVQSLHHWLALLRSCFQAFSGVLDSLVEVWPSTEEGPEEGYTVHGRPMSSHISAKRLSARRSFLADRT